LLILDGRKDKVLTGQRRKIRQERMRFYDLVKIDILRRGKFGRACFDA